MPMTPKCLSKEKRILRNTVTVEVDLDDIDVYDLIEYLKDHEFVVIDDVSLLEKIYEKVIAKQDYSEEIRELLWETIGKTVE